MRLAFRPLPGIQDITPRPTVPVYVQGIQRIPFLCLLDTGALHNRFAAWIAREAGIDLSGAEPASIGVGGRSVIARTVTARLRLAETEWEAPVAFCEPWPWDFNLLGQQGFLSWFRVVIEAADHTLQVTPHR